MSWLKNFVKKAGDTVKKVGTTIAKAKDVILPIAGVAVGLVAPALGGVIGKLTDKIGKSKVGGILDKVSEATGIGDGKPGIFGIGDGKPGIFGIGTGKAALKALQKLTEEDLAHIQSADVKLKNGEALTEEEQLAKVKQKEVEAANPGIPTWVKVAGAAAAAAFLL